MTPTDDVQQGYRYLFVAIASVVVSVGGVLVAVYFRNEKLGSIGGVISTALAFCVLFIRKDWGLLMYKRRMGRIPNTLSPTEKSQYQIDCVVQAFEINSSGVTIQNLALAAATIVGTVFAAYGERWAKLLIG